MFLLITIIHQMHHIVVEHIIQYFVFIQMNHLAAAALSGTILLVDVAELTIHQQRMELINIFLKDVVRLIMFLEIVLIQFLEILVVAHHQLQEILMDTIHQQILHGLKLQFIKGSHQSLVVDMVTVQVHFLTTLMDSAVKVM